MENIEIKGTIIPDVEGENGRYYVELPRWLPSHL